MQNRLNWMMTFALVLLTACVFYQGWKIGRLEVELTNFRAGVEAWVGADTATDAAQDRFNRKVMACLEAAR